MSAELAAYVRMEPRIGPMHGVHPAPNAIPTSNVPRYPTGLFAMCTRRSCENNETLKTPSMYNPNTMISTPPMRLIQSR